MSIDFGWRLVLAMLAVYRISLLFSWDLGPYGIFEKLRSAVGRLATEGMTWKQIADALHCAYCLGIWLSAAILFLVIVETRAGNIILLWFGIAGGQAVLMDLARKTFERE